MWKLPKESNFPKGTTFIIKEWDVPLIYIPQQGYFNWYGGKATPYDDKWLKIDNNVNADSFEEWLNVLKNSIKVRNKRE